MARSLHLLVWISVLNMSLSQYPPLPPYWEWGRQYDTFNNWQVAASAYKYPSPQQLRFATFPLDYENQEHIRPGPDCTRLNARSSEVPHESKEIERSIASTSQVHEEIRVYQPKVEETIRRSENGSSKILNGFFKPGRRRVHVDSNQITFPGPTARNRFVLEIPEWCKDATFCEDVPNYPQDVIDKVITEIGDKGRSLTLEKLDRPDTPDITQRVGPTEENVELCDAQDKVVYPLSAKGYNDQWYTLVNSKVNPVQGFRVEICRNTSSPCADIVSFNTGYVGRCKQKYVSRSVLVVEEKPDKTIHTVEKSVKLPSCCTCVAKAVIT